MPDDADVGEVLLSMQREGIPVLMPRAHRVAGIAAGGDSSSRCSGDKQEEGSYEVCGGSGSGVPTQEADLLLLAELAELESDGCRVSWPAGWDSLRVRAALARC
jgi:hypothetical protein